MTKNIPSFTESGLTYGEYLKTYHPAKYKKYLAKRAVYRENWNVNNPIKARQQNVKHVNTWKAKNMEVYHQRQREYQQKFLKDPINKRGTQLRAMLRTAVLGFDESRVDSRFHQTAKMIIEAKQKDPTLNVCHIVAIRHFITFNKKIPAYVIHDTRNIEMKSKEINSSRRNFIDDRVLATAKRLENTYPDELEGFVEYLKKIQPEYRDYRV